MPVGVFVILNLTQGYIDLQDGAGWSLNYLQWSNTALHTQIKIFLYIFINTQYMYMYVMDICRNISVEAPWGQELSDIFSY